MTDATPIEPQRLMIVDDHPTVAGALESILRDMLADVEIERATTVEQATRILARFAPDMIFLDLDLPDSKGVASLNALRAKLGEARRPQFVIWSGSTSSAHMRTCYEASAVAYISKSLSIDDTRRAIGCVLSEGSYWPSGWDSGPTLHRRELQLLQLLAQGKSHAEVAKAMHIGTNTAKTYFHRLYKALGVTKAVAAVAKGKQLGLID